jgi:hypothetical protein
MPAFLLFCIPSGDKGREREREREGKKRGKGKKEREGTQGKTSSHFFSLHFT